MFIFQTCPGRGENELPDGDELLYPGAKITKAQSILLHMAFVMKHNLTKAPLEDYLALINELYPALAPTTKYLFLKAFDMQKEPNLHYYCENCNGHINDENVRECVFCKHPFKKKSAYDRGRYFITFNPKNQIQHILENNVLRERTLRMTKVSVIFVMVHSTRIKLTMKLH